MGLDFLQKTAKSHTKAWSDEFLRAADDLFAPACNPIDRSYLASIQAEGTLEEGDSVAIRLYNEKVCVFKDIFPLATIDKPSLDLVETLHACFGVLSGFIEEKNEFANSVTVFVGEKGRSHA